MGKSGFAAGVFEGFKDSSTFQTYTPPYYQRLAVTGPPPTFQAAWARRLQVSPANTAGVKIA